MKSHQLLMVNQQLLTLIMKSEKARFEFDARLADHRVKHCLVCSICWEAPNSKKRREVMRTNYYENFPSYGKPKETCPKCKESITQ